MFKASPWCLFYPTQSTEHLFAKISSILANSLSHPSFLYILLFYGEMLAGANIQGNQEYKAKTQF